MSSVAEMQSLVHEAADAAGTGNWKDRVQAAARVLNLPFSRAKALYYREYRCVRAEEMDNARAAIRALREEEARRKATEHVAWLHSQLAYLRSVDPDGYREQIAGLEWALDRVGQMDRAVAVRTPTDTGDEG